jgi:hypothetical protein
MTLLIGCLVLAVGGWFFGEISSLLSGDKEKIFNQAAIAMLLGVTVIAFPFIGEIKALAWFFLMISFPTTVGFLGHKLYFRVVTS